MRPKQTHLAIFKKFNFEKPPVGVKYLFREPHGIQQPDKKLDLCEMLPEAQQRGISFYFTKENENCFGKQTLGIREELAREFQNHKTN